VAQSPVDAYAAHAPGSRAIVFATHVKAALAHVMEFRAKGVKAELITGEMHFLARRTILELFRRGHIQVLVNVFVLTEGFDVPAVDTVILARGCQSAGAFLQMLGRALRPSPGKTHATLLDLRGVTHVHGTAEEERVYSLDGRGIRRKNEVTERYCQVCGVLLSPENVVCPDCGREPDELTAPKVTGDKLTKFVYRPRATDDEKAAKLAELMRLAREKGYNPKASSVKYSVLFGTWPTPAIRDAAFSLLRARAS
jgi:superfamily II DNA or RNA helicase